MMDLSGVGRVQSVEEIQHQLMVISGATMNQLMGSFMQLMRGTIGEQTIARLLKQVSDELLSIKQKVTAGTLPEASYPFATLMLRLIFQEMTKHEALDDHLRRMLQHFELDNLESELLACDGYKFTQDWFSFHTGHWEQNFGYFHNQPGLRFLEIGSFEGRSTAWMLTRLLTHPTSTITCIDPFTDHQQQEAYFDFNIARSGLGAKVFKLHAFSQAALPMLPRNSYDLIYVDGSHVDIDVLQDGLLAWPLLKSGGIMVFDDYEIARLYPQGLGPNTRRGIDAFLAYYRDQFEVVHTGWQIAIKKR